MCMRRAWPLLAAALWAQAGTIAALPPPETVTFHAPVYESDATIALTANLYRPEGAGPHPAVVDLHGCNGIWPVRSNAWYAHYLEWGLAVLQVDSFAPRGFRNICGSLFDVPTWHRARDAHGAKRWLAGQAWVQPEQIYLTGFSHGATAALLALDDDVNAAAPFAGAIAVAPWCLETLRNSHTDLLVLIGALDLWTPAQRCRVMSQRRPERMQLVVYEGAYHSFDAPGVQGVYLGNRVEHNARAAQAAVRQAHEFFRQRLGR